MLPPTARRVVASAPSCVAAISTPTATTAAIPALVRGHQRRCSSSKPSRSDNGSDGVAAAGTSTVPASARADGKATGERRKRKSKDATEPGISFKKLPSVPSTHHMSQEALGLSSFFSLHRPISITQTMPRKVTEEHFASIFTPRGKAGKISETMTTLSDTIDNLEGSMGSITIGHHDGQEANDGFQRVELKGLDGSESSFQLQIDAMSGEFLPFRPPPLPQAQSGDAAQAASQQEMTVEEIPSHRSYKAMFTIEETTEPTGQVRIVAHSARIMDESQPRSFLERLARRQLKKEEAQGRHDMHAISVLRRRKLKMKKKKYKKLMRRTRNERRKQGRT